MGSLEGTELSWPMNFENHWSKQKLAFHSLPEDGVSGLAIKLILFFEKRYI